MVVDSLIENIKTKIIIKFHFINFMIYLARVANSMVIFSASYPLQPIQEVLYGHVGYQSKAYVNTSGAIGAIWKIQLSSRDTDLERVKICCFEEC